MARLLLRLLDTVQKMDPLELETAVMAMPEEVAPEDEQGSATPRLVVLSGPHLGRKIMLTKEKTTIGRSPEAEICLDDPSLSRLHAVVRCLPGRAYEVEDLGSRNGTFADGIRIHGPRLLQAGDRIQLGARIGLQFVVEDQVDEQLLDAQKLEAVGRLSAGITHDFNNLLSVLEANSSYMSELDADTRMGSEVVRECLADMRAATRQATELTRSLAALARRGSEEQGIVSVTALCDEVVRLIQRVVPKSVQVRSEIAPRLMVEGSQTRLHQLLLNPCINARDAMPNGGTLTVRARMGDPSKEGVSRRLGAKPHIVIEIEDDGPGMDEKTAKQAFDAFFTTKGTGGTGLGLATVAKVAREHGGLAEIASVPGYGTTLRVLLPSCASTGVVEPARVTCPIQGQDALAGVHVLLVEDNPSVARAVARGLRLSGHHVALASDGVEALECFKRSRPEVVVMDLDMPRMDGATCLRLLRELDSTVKVIVISGSGSPSLDSDLRARGAHAFLPKPLDHRQLSRAVGTTSPTWSDAKALGDRGSHAP